MILFFYVCFQKKSYSNKSKGYQCDLTCMHACVWYFEFIDSDVLAYCALVCCNHYFWCLNFPFFLASGLLRFSFDVIPQYFSRFVFYISCSRPKVTHFSKAELIFETTVSSFLWFLGIWINSMYPIYWHSHKNPFCLIFSCSEEWLPLLWGIPHPPELKFCVSYRLCFILAHCKYTIFLNKKIL